MNPHCEYIGLNNTKQTNVFKDYTDYIVMLSLYLSLVST